MVSSFDGSLVRCTVYRWWLTFFSHLLFSRGQLFYLSLEGSGMVASCGRYSWACGVDVFEVENSLSGCPVKFCSVVARGRGSDSLLMNKVVNGVERIPKG